MPPSTKKTKKTGSPVNERYETGLTKDLMELGKEITQSDKKKERNQSPEKQEMTPPYFSRSLLAPKKIET
jgi:hypothetical protein